MNSRIANLHFAAHTDVGRRRLANEDAVAMDARTGVFVVCDGVGGRPSGEAASQIIAKALPRVFRRQLRRAQTIDADAIQGTLKDTAVEMNASVYAHSQEIPTLQGMGCTLVAALIDGPMLYHLHAGDSRLYLLRRGEIFPLTTDHTYARAMFMADPETGELVDIAEKRLLMQYLGKPEALVPEVGHVPLEDGDRLMLCSDGLTDPVPDPAISELLKDHREPRAACAALVDAANAAGGPDNITVAVIDFQGLHAADPAEMERAASGPREQPRGVAEQTHQALSHLEKHLTWLRQGARAAAHPNRVTATAAAKRHLNQDDYDVFLNHGADRSPLHAFHQCCTHPESVWRTQYAEFMKALQPPLTRMTSGRVVLSPVLDAPETASIIRDLWTGWRRVEQRYFATCQRAAIHESENTLDVLVSHMLSSVQTLAGLLAFFPRFMSETPTAPSPPASTPASET